MEQNFEELPEEQLDDILRQFYGSVLSKNGKEYSRSGLINLRSGLNRLASTDIYIHHPTRNVTT